MGRQLIESLCVFEIFAQHLDARRRHASSAVAALFPALVLKVGTQPNGARTVTRRLLAVLFAERSTLHRGQGGELGKERMALRDGV